MTYEYSTFFDLINKDLTSSTCARTRKDVALDALAQILTSSNIPSVIFTRLSDR